MIDEIFHDTTSTEDEIRRQMMARQIIIGLDKLQGQAEIEHHEDVAGEKLV